MWPEVKTAKEENRRELILSGAAVRKRIEEQKGKLDETIYQLATLNLLDINDTPLQEISPHIANLKQLQSLLLFRNKLSSVPVEIGQLSSLKILDLSGNAIETLPAELSLLKSLTTINLSTNNLRGPIDFSALEHLNVCNLSANKLEQFPVLPCGGEVQFLAELHLEKNLIKEIPPSLEKQCSIRLLNVAENKIELVPKFLATKCNKLKEINLKDNPLKDKRLKKLVEQCRSKQVLDYVEKHGHVITEAASSSKADDTKASTPKEDQPEDKQKPRIDTEFRQLIRVLKAPSDGHFVSFTADAKEIRPYLVHCIVRDFQLGRMKKFLKLQNDLHDGECGKRELATVATHDLTKIKGSNIRYQVDLCEYIEIKPLGSKEKLTAAKYYEELRQQAEAERKAKKRNTYSGVHKYISLLEGKEVFVFFKDDEKVISLPPLTNCDETKLTAESKDILLEVTSSVSMDVCRRVMAALLKGMLLMDVQVSRRVPEAKGEKRPKSKQPSTIVCYDKEVSLNVEQVKLCDAEGSFHSVFPGKGDLIYPEEERIDVEYQQ